MDEIHFAPLGNHGTPLFVAIYKGLNIPGFCRWCRISSLRSMGDFLKVPLLGVGPKGNLGSPPVTWALFAAAGDSRSRLSSKSRRGSVIWHPPHSYVSKQRFGPPTWPFEFPFLATSQRVPPQESNKTTTDSLEELRPLLTALTLELRAPEEAEVLCDQKASQD